MGVELPSISSGLIEYLSVCALIDIDGNELRSALDDFDADAKYSEDEWVHLAVGIFRGNGAEKDVGHAHVDLARSGYFRGRKPKPRVELPEVASRLDVLAACSDAQLTVRARFVIPKDKIPKRGLISAMSGVSTQIEGAELNLTGATLSVSGDDVLDELTWRQEADSAELKLRITASMTADMNEHYLVSARDISLNLISKYVL